MVRHATRSGASLLPVVIGLALLALVLWLLTRRHVVVDSTTPAAIPDATTDTGRTVPGGPVAGGFGRGATVSPPPGVDFDGCPAVGDGGDRDLNVLKNRADEGRYVAAPFDTIASLSWPASIGRRRRADWSRADRRAIGRYEGTPVAVIGYLAAGKQEGPEATNCHGADARYRDFHIWLTASADERDRSHSVVVEATPRLRAAHPAWTLKALRRLGLARERVRVSGWLMLDQEHPEQLGRTRGTLWEIHPMTRLEVEQGGQWISIDSIAR